MSSTLQLQDWLSLALTVILHPIASVIVSLSNLQQLLEEIHPGNPFSQPSLVAPCWALWALLVVPVWQSVLVFLVHCFVYYCNHWEECCEIKKFSDVVWQYERFYLEIFRQQLLFLEQYTPSSLDSFFCNCSMRA